MKKALILAALLTCGSAHAQSLEVDVRIAPGGGLQYLTFTSREDSIVLTGFIINRGNCLEARGPGGAQKLFNLPKIDMHQTIRFGETVNFLFRHFHPYAIQSKLMFSQTKGTLRFPWTAADRRKL